MILAASLLLLLVLAALLATGNGWSNVLSSPRNEVVFAGRNQAYGAYVIRREHHRVMMIAFFSATALVGSILTIPKLFPSDPGMRNVPFVPTSDTTIFILPPVDDITPPDPHPPVHRSVLPPDFFNPLPRDTMPDVEPKDTIPHDPGPVGPVVPVGPIGPIGPPGGGGGEPRDTTTIVDGWRAEVAPEYPGGMDALQADLGRIIRYPDIDIDGQIEGRVVVGFVVSDEGYITDAVIMKGVSRTIDAEALRVVRKLKRWKPGEYNGHTVKVRFQLPINFKISRN